MASGFVKFFGQGSNRSPRDRAVLDAVKTSGSHRICTYPRGRRPRAVREGDVMFLGHLVSGPKAENADRGIGNVDPRQSIRQAAAVRLTEAGTSWLEEELGRAFRRFGKVRAESVEGLDWEE